MFTAPPASPISTSCAEFLRKRYPSLLLYLPIDAPKTINKNKKSKTYIRMGRAQYRERRTGQKKEKSGRTGRAPYGGEKKRAKERSWLPEGSRETNRRKEKARTRRRRRREDSMSRSEENGPQKRRRRAAEAASEERPHPTPRSRGKAERDGRRAGHRRAEGAENGNIDHQRGRHRR